MAFERTMPMRSRRPSRDGRLKAVSVRKRAPKAPTVARGAARSMMSGTSREPKKITRIA
jgi:hypothetical protein